MASSSSSDSVMEVTDFKNSGVGNSDYKVDLQRAIRMNYWNKLRELLEEFPEFKTEPITEDGETVLILVAKQGKKSNLILKYLVRVIPRSELTRGNRRGNTALHAAAVVGNVDGAKTLLDSNPDLANISNVDGHLPFHVAVTHVQRDLILFLLGVRAPDVRPYPS